MVFNLKIYLKVKTLKWLLLEGMCHRDSLL